MAFGITPEGFRVKRLEDIKTEIKDTIENTFGSTANLDDASPFGQFLSIFAERESEVWELAEDIYQSQYPFGSEGASLDFVCSLTGTTRKSATRSTVDLKLFGTIGTIIPIGSIASVENSTSARFQTTVEALIGAGTDEVQTITYSSVPNAGSYTLSFEGQITSAIQWDATAGDIQSALIALSNIEDVLVAGTKETFFTVTFQNADGSKDQPLLEVSINGLQALEVTLIDTVADVAQSLHRTYLTAYDSVGSVDFWINVNNQLGATKNPHASDRDVEITTVLENDSAIVVATKIAAAMDAEPGGQFTGSSSGIRITATATLAGSRTDSDAGDTGFTVTTDNQGQDPGTLLIDILQTVVGQIPNATAAAEAIDTGAIAASAGQIKFIETGVSGWDSVVNELDAVIGDDRETDPELKIRREEELAIAGKATTDAIFAALSDIVGVTGVVVFKNNNNIPNPDPILASETKAIRDVTFVADVAQSLHEKYMTLQQFEGPVDVWINVNNQGGATKTPNPSYRDIEITTVMENDSAATIATKIKTELNLDDQFVVTDDAAPEDKIITNAFGAKLPDSSAGNSGFTVDNVYAGLNSIPAHAVAATVQGGDEDEIAETLFSTVAGGIGTSGDVLKTVVDDQGFTQQVRFSRPEERPIYCIWELSIDSSNFPMDGETQVINATVLHGSSLGIGGDIIVNPELISGALGEIPGITDSVAKIGDAPAPTLSDNIVIAPNEISLWDSVRVSVVIVATS